MEYKDTHVLKAEHPIESEMQDQKFADIAHMICDNICSEFASEIISDFLEKH